MTLGVFLSSGESRQSFLRLGQLPRLNMYLQIYARHFSKVHLFAYDTSFVHRYVWMFLMPFFRWHEMQSCNVYRVLQFPGVLPALIGKFLFQKRILVTYGYRYDKFLALDSAWMQRGLLRILEIISFPFIDRFLVTTDVLATYLHSRGISFKRIVKVPNGVDVTSFRPSRRSRGNRMTILFVGRLEKQKNIPTLIEAMSRLEQKESVHLHIVGSGSMKEQIIESAHRLSVNVEINDVIPQDQLPPVYQHADFFILPSLNEGQPKVLLEAMSCGLPCIVARFPGVEEIIEDGRNGIIVVPTADAIHQSIRLLLRDPKKAKTLGRRARETILRSFDLRELLQKEMKILKELVG